MIHQSYQVKGIVQLDPISKERVKIAAFNVQISNPDLPDCLFLLFVCYRLLKLLHLENALSILALFIPFVGTVPFLVALETFHILQIHCIRRVRYFCISFAKDTPDGVLLVNPCFLDIEPSALLSFFLGLRTLNSLRYLNNIPIISQFMSCLGHFVH